ncbi:unnamed protein product [Sphagnum tenellum]
MGLTSHHNLMLNWIHQNEYMEWVDGIAWCFNKIDIFVHEGSEVEVDYCTKKIYYPLKARQTTMKLSLYSSSQKNPRYTTDGGTVLEGTIVVDMSKNLELGKDRKVEVSMFFGHTSIEVKAHGDIAMAGDRGLFQGTVERSLNKKWWLLAFATYRRHRR